MSIFMTPCVVFSKCKINNVYASTEAGSLFAAKVIASRYRKLSEINLELKTMNFLFISHY